MSPALAITKENLHELFTYHPPKTEARRKAHGDMNEASELYASVLLDCCPDSPERTLAFRHIQTARMFANAAIALYMPDESEPAVPDFSARSEYKQTIFSDQELLNVIQAADPTSAIYKAARAELVLREVFEPIEVIEQAKLDSENQPHQFSASVPVPQIIAPTVGRIVYHFQLMESNDPASLIGPLAAIITKVHDERKINVTVFGVTEQFSRQSVILRQPGDDVPQDWCWCEWMP